MSKQPEKYVCQKCDSELNISIAISSDGSSEINEEGLILVSDVPKSYVEDVLFWECTKCGAIFEETGWQIENRGYGENYLVPWAKNTAR